MRIKAAAGRPPNRKVPAEFERAARGLAFTSLPDVDAYAPQTGFVAGFPAARDLKADRAWLVHCYGSSVPGVTTPRTAATARSSM